MGKAVFQSNVFQNSVFQLSLDESILLRERIKTVTETISIQSFRDRSRVIKRVISEGISLSESLYKGWIKRVNNTVNIVAVNMPVFSITKIISEVLSIGKAVFQSNVFQNSVFQNTIDETVALLGKVRVISETVQASDAFKMLRGMQRVVTSMQYR